jgi:NAD(P)-dependent dehydrogenase (short-subunit alcohol dehydrogenase family)
MRLKDKVALITGGGGDIAKGIAEKFIANGASVVLFDLNPELLQAAVQELSAGSALQAVAGNVCKLEDLEQAAAVAEQSFGKIDILVTCAGVIKHAPIDELSVEDWNRIIDINLTGTFLSCKAVVPGMKKRKYGRIVTISSIGGRTGRPTVGVNYAASKAGTIGFTQTLARELGNCGITVNSIAPGPLAGRMTASMNQESLARLASVICTGRLGRAEDVANAAIYLASDEADWVTGEVLDVNGGAHI